MQMREISQYQGQWQPALIAVDRYNNEIHKQRIELVIICPPGVKKKVQKNIR